MKMMQKEGHLKTEWVNWKSLPKAIFRGEIGRIEFVNFVKTAPWLISLWADIGDWDLARHGPQIKEQIKALRLVRGWSIQELI
jgi:hypothetical protein